MRQLFQAACAALFIASPLAAEVNQDAILARKPPKTLAEFGFFQDLTTMQPDAALVGYTLSAPLFTDYADKTRYIYAPGPAPYQTDGVLAFPVGSALIKTFHYGDRKIETRVLVHKADGWVAYPYLWNDAGDAAVLKLAGKTLDIETDHGAFAYHVPNFNQCKACHVDADKAFQPIGPKVRNLNTGDQLARLVQAGVLSDASADAPAVPDYSDISVPLDQRARAYLDANCGHCHAPGLPADTSGLYLNWEEARDIHLGIHKTPVAAGRGSGGLKVSIDPGHPDRSILLHRLQSDDPGVMMPEIGRALVHAEGVALIRDWIAQMD